jgi:predicted enzyme related to lactoylglutathione lyase
MPIRDTAPVGAPCWIELSTSDPDQSRAFYRDLFGWTAQEPHEGLGGYFTFWMDGCRVAGGMPSQPGGPADRWAVYLASDDAHATLEAAQAAGGHVVVPATPVGDFGSMAVVTDPSGDGVGVWEPRTHPGFGVVDERGAPTWFELRTDAHATAVSFYRNAFGWDGDTARSVTISAAETGTGWYVSFGSDDVDADLGRIVQLGGTVVSPARDTPFGRVPCVADPTGARFMLVQGAGTAVRGGPGSDRTCDQRIMSPPL